MTVQSRSPSTTIIAIVVIAAIVIIALFLLMPRSGGQPERHLVHAAGHPAVGGADPDATADICADPDPDPDTGAERVGQ